jgi:hypothetical protein
MERGQQDVPGFAETAPTLMGDWTIEQKIGVGPYGRETASVIGRKAGAVIEAVAWNPEIAFEMLTNMIEKREVVTAVDPSFPATGETSRGEGVRRE